MDELTYEAALSRLEDIVRQLERGELSLEDSMLRFEDGIGLSRTCASKLAAAEGRISRLVDEGGGLRLAPLTLEAAS
jgi:exodeoxyribonuclease VII small subunit